MGRKTDIGTSAVFDKPSASKARRATAKPAPTLARGFTISPDTISSLGELAEADVGRIEGIEGPPGSAKAVVATERTKAAVAAMTGKAARNFLIFKIPLLRQDKEHVISP
jgi:hypothetical protein